MRALLRRVSGWTAIYVIALHTVLWGVAPLASGMTLDPYSVICHSDIPTTSPDDQSPAGPAPAHACDHCNLCSAASPPSAPDAAVTARFEPVLILRVHHNADIARRDDIATGPKLARGPPAFA